MRLEDVIKFCCISMQERHSLCQSAIRYFSKSCLEYHHIVIRCWKLGPSTVIFNILYNYCNRVIDYCSQSKLSTFHLKWLKYSINLYETNIISPLWYLSKLILSAFQTLCYHRSELTDKNLYFKISNFPVHGTDVFKSIETRFLFISILCCIFY